MDHALDGPLPASLRADAVPPASAGEAPRPSSASGTWTGIVGLVTASVAIYLLRDWLQPTWLKTLCVLAAPAVTMLLLDMLVYRTSRRPSTGMAADPLRPFDFGRVSRKLIGLWVTLGLVAALYALLPEYADPFYAPFKQACLWCLPGLVVLSPLYIAYVDRRMRAPVDAYAELASLLLGQRPAAWRNLLAHARGWAIKAFFLPLMFVYTNNNLAGLWAGPSLLPMLNFEALFSAAIGLFYLFDVLLAAIAYGLTLRLLDTHIRSAEPTVAGWVFCLFCYRPFWSSVGTRYLVYDQDNLYWGKIFAPYPVLYVAWGTLILVLVAIYLWSTAAFGLRFSNLTNRGIITNGPYRWVKHPAYLSKNLSWWLISLPFIPGAGWPVALQSCVLLGGINAIYWLRAKTEERHLGADPAYRDYQAYIARHGLWAQLRRLAVRP